LRRPSATWRRNIFVAVWAAANVVLGWQLLQGQHEFSSPGLPISLLVLLLCTVALLWWIPSPLAAEPADRPTRKGWFVLIVLAAIGLLLAVVTLVGRLLVLALPVVAVVTLVWLRQPITRREALYALGLALVAGLAGLGAGWITFITPVQWAVLQVFLVLTGLLAGWAMLRYSGLLPKGVGRSLFLSEGVIAAGRGLGQGILIGTPWALGTVVMGGSMGSREAWVHAWWQPILAIQPGIAEEAWGRLLLVPLLFLALRRVSPAHRAFPAALVVIGYWFAYLHTSGGPGAIISTLLIGTLFALPLSYVCLYRDLETAIGFHFWIDCVKFAFALILFNR